MDENLRKKISNWEVTGRWDKIIDFIEKINPKDRSPELTIELGSAYLNSAGGDWNKRDLAKKALKVLAPLEDEHLDDKNELLWCFLYGNTLYNLDQWSKAYFYFDISLDLEPEPNMAQMIDMMRTECAKNVLFPHFREPFDSRIKRVWKEFEKRQDEFLNILKKDPTQWTNVSTMCDGIFKDALEGVNLFVGISEGNPTKKPGDPDFEMMFLGDKNLLRLFELQYLVDNAPQSVLNNWILLVGAPERFSTPIKDPDHELNHIFLHLAKEEDGILTFDHYWGYEVPDEDEKDRAFNEYYCVDTVADWMVDIAGTATFEKYIRLGKLFFEKPKGSLIPILELPNLLKEKGIDYWLPTPTVLSQERSYVRTPNKKEVDVYYRADILQGKSKCMKVLQDYEHNDSKNVEALEADGVAVGCLFYRTDNFRGVDRQKRMKDFQASLKRHLMEKVGKEGMEIIGEAYGIHFNYLDFMGWNIRKVLAYAQEFFKTSTVPFSGYHPMRKRCGNVLLTGKNRWIPHKGVDSDPLAHPFWRNGKNKDIH